MNDFNFLKKKLSQGETEACLNVLEDFLKDTTYYSDYVLISGRYYDYKKKYTLGIIRAAEAQVTESETRYALNNMIDDIEKDTDFRSDKKFYTPITTTKNNNSVKYLLYVIPALLIAIGIGLSFYNTQKPISTAQSKPMVESISPQNQSPVSAIDKEKEQENLNFVEKHQNNKSNPIEPSPILKKDESKGLNQISDLNQETQSVSKQEANQKIVSASFLEIGSNKRDNTFHKGEMMKFFVKIDHPGFLRVIYETADKNLYLIHNNYYLDDSKTNKEIPLSSDFTCSEPFGQERLLVFFKNEEFERLSVETQAQLSRITEPLDDVLKICRRGLQPIVKKRVVEKALIITTKK
jgi:hypothetical protein